jgi:hypothetical protein
MYGGTCTEQAIDLLGGDITRSHEQASAAFQPEEEWK